MKKKTDFDSLFNLKERLNDSISQFGTGCGYIAATLMLLVLAVIYSTVPDTTYVEFPETSTNLDIYYYGNMDGTTNEQTDTEMWVKNVFNIKISYTVDTTYTYINGNYVNVCFLCFFVSVFL